jgi:micrococcal nuclease
MMLARAMQRSTLRCAVLTLVLVAPHAPLAVAAQGFTAPIAPARVEQKGWKCEAPRELFDVERVVDADTIWVRRNGETQKLRLLSVDTEERFGGSASDPTKPQTAFGEACAQWAAEYFRAFEKDGKPAQVGLLFPGGVEERDAYGRILCYVILADGRNFNLLLVQLGKSPYFTKYGASEVCHAAFVEAQREAREAKLGIWDPATNEPKTAGAPAAKRPYERLLPWWDARAVAVDSFRSKRAADPRAVASAESPAQLAAALATSAAGREVEVFGLVDRLFDEDDGSRTVLFRSGSKSDAFRARIPEEFRATCPALDLERIGDEFRQNYVWVQGRLERGARGFEMTTRDPTKWRLAGPEPVYPEAAASPVR